MKINYCFGKKRKNKLIILLLLSVFLISCNDSTIELSTINFPVKKESLINKNKFEVKESKYKAGLLTYEVSQFTNYKFFDEIFDGEIVQNSATYSGENYLQFIGNQKDINGFQIHIYTKNESQKLLKTLVQNLGKPSFEEDKGFEKYFIWENSGNIYILNQGQNAVIQNEKTIESDLLYLNINNLGDVAISATSNTKYSDYLEHRLKYKKNSVTYPYSAYLKEVN